MNDREANIASLCDGVRKSSEIAAMLGDNPKYVQRTMKKYNLPRRPQGAQRGFDNPSWCGGRSIDLDGYATIPAPPDLQGRAIGRIAEHRFVMARLIGRDLLETEVVDHIDGLHLHNHPSNLRLFQSNADHLKATISGQIPQWSQAGWDRMNTAHHLRADQTPVDTYRQRRKRGDVRLQQILLAALQFGIDSPHLLGTRRHLEKAGIFDFSRTSLERALDDLCRKYA